MSHLHGKDGNNKSNTTANKDESYRKAVDNMHSETVKSSSIQEKVLDNKHNDDNKPFQENTNLKTDIQSILNSEHC